MHAQVTPPNDSSVALPRADASVCVFQTRHGTGTRHVEGIRRPFSVDPVRDAVGVHSFVASETKNMIVITKLHYYITKSIVVVQLKDNLAVVSFNCKSVERSVEHVRTLCESADVIALQET